MNKMFKQKKGQDSQPLRNFFLIFLVISAVGMGMFSFINDGLVSNYDTPEITRESELKVFQDSTDEVTESLDDIRIVLSSGDSSTIDIIQVMIGRGFEALITLLTAPFNIASSLINSSFESLGIDSGFKRIASFGVLTIVLFGIIALIMKVRA